MDILKNDINNITKEMLIGLNDPIEDCSTEKFLIGNSKYIRSRIALLLLKNQNCEITSKIYKLLAVGEIIHNASLLQDDVIDEAELRRGKTTISKTFSPKISILLGDYLLAFAIEKLLEIDNSKIMTLFKDCTKKMCIGEIEQFFLRGKTPSKEQYLKICEFKTANLFSTIFESCAILSNLDTKLIQEFGKLFGIYFQIKNDLDKASSDADKRNKIHTAIDIMGVEKTQILLDNYQEKMRILLEKFPNNIYKENLEELIKNYDN